MQRDRKRNTSRYSKLLQKKTIPPPRKANHFCWAIIILISEVLLITCSPRPSTYFSEETLRTTSGDRDFRELSLRAEWRRKEASEEKFFSAHRLGRGRRELWFLRFSGRGRNHWAGQGRAGRLESRGRGSYFMLEPRLPRQLWLTGVYMCIRRRKLTNKSLLCVPQLYVVWSKYPHVCTDRKYNGILSLTLSSNSK